MRHLLEQRDRAPVCLGKRREDRQTTRKGLGGIKTQQHHRNVERGPAKSQTRPPNRLHRKRPEAQAEPPESAEKGRVKPVHGDGS